MHWQYNPFVLPPLLAAIVAATIALYAWHRRTAPGARPFALLVLAVAEWSLTYALAQGGRDLPSILFWDKVKYLALVTVPATWLAFMLQYTGREKLLTSRNMVLLAIEPVITLLLVWTNEVHGLIYSNIVLDTTSLPIRLDLTFGVWSWVHTVYSYLLMVLSSLLLIQTLIRSSHPYRAQAGVLLIGAFIPWVGNALSISGVSPFSHLDLTPFAFTLSSAVVIWALFRLGLLDLVPVARDAVIENMSDAVLVLDAQNRVVDINPTAQRIIGCTATQAIGQPVRQILSAWPGLVERYRSVMETRTDITLGEGEAQRHYDLRISPLYDRQSRFLGRLIMARDITERKQAEAELRRYQEHLEELVEERTAELEAANDELALAYDTTLEGWSRALDLRDKETEGHTQRVAELTVRLARALGVHEAELVHIRRGALLHDIGKMGIPDGVLLKPGPLSSEEWEIMRKHPVYAYELLAPISYLSPILDIPYYHHEKWDGSGYPRGLRGEQIPLAVRIFAVVDVWDALRSDRPYRDAWPKDQALQYIKEQAGRHFDPQVVDMFLRIAGNGHYT